MGIQIQMYVGDNDTLKDHPNITMDGWIPLEGHGCQDEDEMRDYVQNLDRENLRLRVAEIEGPTVGLSPFRVKMKEDKWPADGEPADFNDLVDPLVEAFKFCYALRRKNRGIDVPWSGPNIGKKERVTCHDPLYALSADRLDYNEREQDREAIEVILGIAIQLGIEQGRRIFRTSDEFKHMLVMRDMDRILIDSLKATQPK